MKNREMQVVWAAAGFYHGGIDGILGAKSTAAMNAALDKHAPDYKWRRSLTRNRVASVQACLNSLGYEAGAVDGLEGHNTREALNGLLYFLATGKKETVTREAVAKPASRADLPRQSEVRQYYGDPANMRSNLVTIELPFKLRIDYNLRQSTNRITVHKRCADSLKAALVEVHEHYGAEKMRELGIDRYAGAYNKRKMRGGSKWSMHAYGCAIDFYARPNGLRERCPRALFCSAEYKPFLDIMEKHGWLPAIRLWGADAMHFQAARL